VDASRHGGRRRHVVTLSAPAARKTTTCGRSPAGRGPPDGRCHRLHPARCAARPRRSSRGAPPTDRHGVQSYALWRMTVLTDVMFPAGWARSPARTPQRAMAAWNGPGYTPWRQRPALSAVRRQLTARRDGPRDGTRTKVLLLDEPLRTSTRVRKPDAGPDPGATERSE